MMSVTTTSLIGVKLLNRYLGRFLKRLRTALDTDLGDLFRSATSDIADELKSGNLHD